MKIEKVGEDQFQPFTLKLEIENINDLKWLYAISNTNTDDALRSFSKLTVDNFPTKEMSEPQMKLFNKLAAIYKSVTNAD